MNTFKKIFIFLRCAVIVFLFAGKVNAIDTLNAEKSKTKSYDGLTMAHMWNIDTPLLEKADKTQTINKNEDTKLNQNDRTEIENLQKISLKAESNKRDDIDITKEQAEATWQLGLLYLHGIGVNTNPAKALQLFQLSWSGHENQAALGLAWCAINGCGSPPNRQAAINWINNVEKFNPGRALFLEWYSQSIMAPIVSSAPIEPEKKKIDFDHHELLVSSAEKNDVQANIEIGIEAAKNNELIKALRLFKLIKNQSETAARNAKLIEEKINYQKISAKKNLTNKDKESNLILKEAIKFHRGDGVPTNYYQAIQLYKEAANLGNSNAKKMLNLIFSKSYTPESIDIIWMRQLSQIDIFSDNWDIDFITGPKLLTRDPTPITDFLAIKWQKHIYSN